MREVALRRIPTVDELFRRRFTRKLAATLERLAEKEQPNHAWFFDRYVRAKLKRDCVMELAEIKHRHGVAQEIEGEMEMLRLIGKDMEKLESYLLPQDWIQPRTGLTRQEFNEALPQYIGMGIEPLHAVGVLVKYATGKAPRKRGRKPTKKHITLLALELNTRTTLKWREIADEVCPEGAHKPHKYDSSCVDNLYREVNHLKKFMKNYDATHDLGKNPLIKSR